MAMTESPSSQGRNGPNPVQVMGPPTTSILTLPDDTASTRAAPRESDAAMETTLETTQRQDKGRSPRDLIKAVTGTQWFVKSPRQNKIYVTTEAVETDLETKHDSD
jgi:hypothetical protein